MAFIAPTKALLGGMQSRFNRMLPRIILIIVLSCCATVNPCMYADDIADDLGRASKHFTATMDALNQDAATVKDAEGLVKILNTWSAENNAIAEAVGNINKKHPELQTSRKNEPAPPEIQAITAKFQSLKTQYPDLLTNTNNLVKRFGNDRAVAAALKGFQGSLEHLQHMQ